MGEGTVRLPKLRLVLTCASASVGAEGGGGGAARVLSTALGSPAGLRRRPAELKALTRKR